MQRLDGVRCGLLDGIGDAEQPGRLAVDGDEHDRLALPAQGLGLRGERLGVHAELRHQCAVAERDLLAVHPAQDTLARLRLEVRCAGELDAALLRAPDDGRGQGVLAAALEARGEAQQRRLIRTCGRGDRDQLGFALGQGAGLVHHEGVDLAHHLDGLGVLEQHPHVRAAPGRHHDGHGRRQPQGARAGDDEHRHGVDERKSHGGLGTDKGPDDEGDESDDHYRRYEVTGDEIGQLLDGCAAALGLGHHLHDLREHRVGPDPLGLHDQAAGAVHGGADDAIARILLHRDGLAGDHRFVHRARALDHLAVHGNLLTGAHAQAVAGPDLIEGHVLLAAVRVDAPRGLGCKTEERTDGRTGAAAGFQLQHLPEQHQGGDHRGRLEVHGDLAMGVAERRREDPGQHRRHHAVGVGDAHAEPDEREHVEAAVHQRAPEAHEEGRAAPQHHRGGEHQLGPAHDPRRAQPLEGQTHVLAHGDDDQRHGERRAHPEAARHVDELGVLLLLEGHRARLERHAADGALARRVAHDLGVHGAHVLGPRRRRARRLGLERHAALGARARTVLLHPGAHGAHVLDARCRPGLGDLPAQVALGVLGELRAAAGAAEAVGLARVGVAVLALGGDRHPAYGVGHPCLDLGVRPHGRLLDVLRSHRLSPLSTPSLNGPAPPRGTR